MINSQEIRNLISHVFSANRRNKAKILFKEWSLGLPSLFFNNQVTRLDLPSDPAPDVWESHESRAISLDFFEKRAVALEQDYVVEDGLVHADHEYTVQKLYGGSSYTNESTHRSVFTKSGDRVELLSCTKGVRRPPPPSRQRIAPSRFVSGITANLYGTIASAEGNYGHWLVDALSRVFMIERYYSLDTIDYILVPPLKYDFHWHSLEALGFERSQVIELQPLDCIQFECLLASSWPRGRGSSICPGWVIDRYRDTLLKKAKDIPSVAGKRVYISRRDAPNRKFLNENEVCEFLENNGFDIVELTPLNLWQKIAVFRDADLIISQTGAGLTNLMFSSSNVKVLELVDERFVYPFYASLAVYGGGTHHPHYFSNESALGRANAMVAKSSIDLEGLGESLVRIESEKSA